MGSPVPIDGFNCKCRYCRKFYKKVHQQPKLDSVLRLPPPETSDSRPSVKAEERVHYKDNLTHFIKIGDRVKVQDKLTGVVKYVGPLDTEVLAPDLYVGIKLDEPKGLHAGIVNGRRYFTAPRGCGLMVKYEEVKKVKPADRRPPVYGNSMFPSYKPNMYSESPKHRNDSNSNSGKPTVKCRKGATATTRQHKTETKRHHTRSNKSKSADPLPTRLQQEASKWRQDKAISQPEILKKTLTKLYLAKEKGKQETEENEKRDKTEREMQDQMQADQLKYGAWTSNWQLADMI